jgi:hypothetical protein
MISKPANRQRHPGLPGRAATQVSNYIATIFVKSNETRSSGGWSADRQCSRRDVVFFSNASEMDRFYDCMMVNHLMMTLGDNPNDFWLSTYNKLNSMGKLAHPMICSIFSKASSSRLDFITVDVCVNPTLAGFADNPGQSWADSSWNRVRITPDRQAFIKTVATWAHAYHEMVANAW